MTAFAAPDAREIRIPAPLEHQEEAVRSAAPRKVIRAGRRGGKTVLAEHAAVVGHGPTDADGVPRFPGIAHGLDVVWVARDYTQAGILWREFVLPRFKDKHGVTVHGTERWVRLAGGGTLFIVSAENISSVRGVGKNLGGVVVEEAAWLDLEDALRNVVLPALMDNDGWLILISTTNAGPDGNPAKRLPSYFNVICQEIRQGERSADWAEFHFTAEDNPRISARAFRDLVAEYPDGSPSLRQEVYAELLTGGVGLALAEVTLDRHLVPRYRVPDHWTRFGAFDWGYNHPYVFGDFAADEDGNVVLVDSVWGRGELPPQIITRIKLATPWQRYGNGGYVVAGHDCWQDHKARGANAPTIAEQFHEAGIALIQANVARVAGLNNLRHFVAWRATEDTPERSPRFTVMDTPGNRRVLRCLMEMQIDPKHPEDALKVDAAPGAGPDGFPVNGDDAYDMTRYALASRPALARPQARRLGADQHPGYVVISGKQVVTADSAAARARTGGNGVGGTGAVRVPSRGRVRVPR